MNGTKKNPYSNEYYTGGDTTSLLIENININIKNKLIVDCFLPLESIDIEQEHKDMAYTLITTFQEFNFDTLAIKGDYRDIDWDNIKYNNKLIKKNDLIVISNVPFKLANQILLDFMKLDLKFVLLMPVYKLFGAKINDEMRKNLFITLKIIQNFYFVVTQNFIAFEVCNSGI